MNASSRLVSYAIAAIALASSPAAADEETVGVCSLVIEGKEVWNGKCCVTASASPTDMLASLHAEGWRACLYSRKHPENERLPTYKQKCLGPWINISEEEQPDAKGRKFSAYWSVKGACHGGASYPAERTGNVYKGDNFIFEWRPAKK